jgi:hypothetical protein
MWRATASSGENKRGRPPVTTFEVGHRVIRDKMTLASGHLKSSKTVGPVVSEIFFFLKQWKAMRVIFYRLSLKPGTKQSSRGVKCEEVHKCGARAQFAFMGENVTFYPSNIE